MAPTIVSAGERGPLHPQGAGLRPAQHLAPKGCSLSSSRSPCSPKTGSPVLGEENFESTLTNDLFRFRTQSLSFLSSPESVLVAAFCVRVQRSLFALLVAQCFGLLHTQPANRAADPGGARPASARAARPTHTRPEAATRRCPNLSPKLDPKHQHQTQN